MAYDFIGLVNDVNSRLNEVELTTDNFATVTGFFAFAKEAVNSAIRQIQQEEYEWPWTYEEYLEKYADAEYNTETKGCPTHIIRTPNRELICYPMPDKAYEMVYEYYRIGYDLISATDVPSIPEQYRFTIVDGAMHYAYQFRGDTASSNAMLQKFQQGIKHLRSININRTDYLRDMRVHF